MTRFAIRVGSLMICATMTLTVAAQDAADFVAKGALAFSRGDLTDAVNWYRKAAEMGHAPAQVRLAELLDYSEQNEAAASWFRQAAEQGEPEGMFGLARMYAAGEGVSKDLARAVELYQQAADNGHTRSLIVLATAYEEGGLGLDADPATALALWQQGADRGDPGPTTRLARAYRNGELGLAPDPAKAKALVEGLQAKQGQKE